MSISRTTNIFWMTRYTEAQTYKRKEQPIGITGHELDADISRAESHSSGSGRQNAREGAGEPIPFLKSILVEITSIYQESPR